MNLRYLAAAATLLTTAGVLVLVNRPESEADLGERVTARMLDALEGQSPAAHNHGGAQTPADASVICGVRVYGYEPAEVTALADVRTVYGFHFCGVAEQGMPWDVAVKLAGPVIVDLSVEPAGIQVVEATEQVPYAARLQQMFPGKYAEMAAKEGLDPAEMADVRRRYEAEAGV